MTQPNAIQADPGAVRQERNRFIGWVIGVFAVAVVFRVAAITAVISTEEELLGWQAAGSLVTVLTKGILLYRVVRLSRALRDHWVQTVVYGVCAMLPLLYLYPIAGLPIIASRSLARSTATSTEEAVGLS